MISDNTAEKVSKDSKLIAELIIRMATRPKKQKQSDKIHKGKNPFERLVKTKNTLSEITVKKDEINDIVKLFRKNKLPCAFVKDMSDGYKCVFFQAHSEMVTDIFKNYLKETMKEKEQEQEREQSNEKNETNYQKENSQETAKKQDTSKFEKEQDIEIEP